MPGPLASCIRAYIANRGQQGQSCAFLQSLVYKRLQMALLLKLNGTISQDERISFRIAEDVHLVMHACASLVDIIVVNPPNSNKRERPGEDDSKKAPFYETLCSYAKRRRRRPAASDDEKKGAQQQQQQQ